MRNKLILSSIVALLFVVAALAGYYGPEALRTYRMERERANFVQAGVPKSISDRFAMQFNRVEKATEPQRLPDAAVLDTSGKAVRISDFAGTPTLVNMWATWCAPCVVELPYLKKFADHYKGRLNVIGIALEIGKKPEDIAAFLEKRDLSGFASYLDASGEFGKNLGIRGIPTSFLIGSDGLILYRFEGEAVWTAKESKDFFDVFLLQKR